MGNALQICFWWAAILGAAAGGGLCLGIGGGSQRGKDSRQLVILKRKIFHLLAVALFLPGTIWTPKFMAICYLGALGAFFVVEFLRLGGKLAFISRMFEAFLKKDKESCNCFVMCHIELLVGCALPLWISLLTRKERQLAFEIGGIAVVGVGDSLAACVGQAGSSIIESALQRREGKINGKGGALQRKGGALQRKEDKLHRNEGALYKNEDGLHRKESENPLLNDHYSSKTIHGTLAFVLGSWVFLAALGLGKGTFLPCVVAALAEAFCNDHDNLICSLAWCIGWFLCGGVEGIGK